MSIYRYIGEDTRVYPDFLIPGEGSLVANPGDERELERNPGDGRWVPPDPEPETQAPAEDVAPDGPPPLEPFLAEE